ncbi:MAG: S49 family peptidase [Caulobacter sp.]|nr:S49 family peptidase [Caulobacter sp.]
MSGRLSSMAARHAGRPLLLTPRAAEELAGRIRAVDSRAFERPGRLAALFRVLSGSRQPQAMDDAEDYTPVPMQERLAYAPLWAGEPDDVGFCWSLKDGVALMQADTALTDRGEEFCGEVYHGYDTLLAAMREAAADERVRATFLRLSSPGGVVAGGLPALAKFMRENRAAAGGKPIWVYADMACSAAYWIAAQADRILAPNVGLIGSIGAVLVHENWSGALAEAGIEITAIQFGDKKTEGAWWGALSPTAKADLQAEIDQCGRNFIADVVAGRPVVTAEAALATQAGVYLGDHDDPARSALALNLIDEIASEEEAFMALRDLVATPSTVSAAGSGALASARTGRSPGAIAAPAAAKENTVKRSTLLAALTAAGVKPQTLASVEAEMPADPEEAAPDPEDEEEALPDAGAAPPSPEQDPPVDAKVAESILDLPEAKGREAMARKLAFTPGMTLETARGLLASAPRGGGLAAEMAGARRLGADTPTPPSGEVRIDVKGVYARRAARRKAKTG